MYQPAPARPKKTDIVRSRTGCKGCRERRTKCDEKKPVCGTCMRLGRLCESVKPKFEFRTVAVANRSRRGGNEGSFPEVEKRGLRSNNNNGQCILNLPQARLLCKSENEIFYSSYWEYHCLPLLHPTFTMVSNLINEFPLLQNAALALSACNLSRLSAEPRDTTASTSGMMMGAFRPNPTHQIRSQIYYSSAIKSFIRLNEYDIRSKFWEVIAVLILFAFVESTRGNFEAFYCHVRGVAVFVDQQEFRNPAHEPVLRGFLTAYMQAQYWVWWARTYFSSLDVQLEHPRIVLPRVLQASSENIYERRVVLLSILHESHRLHSRAVLKPWYRHSSIGEWGSEDYCRLLADESTKLDEWVSRVPPSEQPLPSDNFEGDYEDYNTQIKAQLFHSHDAALNYAYYVMARIMQCTGSLHHRLHDSQCQCNESHAEYWVQRLLRVVQGMDIKACITRNTYTIGVSGLLLAALLQCQNQAFGLWIEDWLQNLQSMHPTEEGSFPVYQSLSVAKVINQQRAMGRDVFGVSQPIDDGGGSPKFSSYNSQMINGLLIHGRYRASGKLFTDHIMLNTSPSLIR